MATEAYYSYEQIQEIAQFLKKQVSVEPKVAIICGNGLSDMVDIVEGRTDLNYSDIPGFPKTAEDDVLAFGSISGIPVVILTRRFYFYEGYSLSELTMPVRLFKLIGCTEILISDTADATNPNYKVGDVLLIKDQVNLLGMPGTNPLKGPNEEKFGDRFPSMNNCYDKDINKFARTTAEELGWGKKIHSGIYAGIAGPTHPTIAESILLNISGIDAVGMSTVAEVIIARHCNLNVLGFSLITKEAVLDYEKHNEPCKDMVSKVIEDAMPALNELLVKVVEFMGDSRICKCISKTEK